jgi:hypothetical protein
MWQDVEVKKSARQKIARQKTGCFVMPLRWSKIQPDGWIGSR